MKIIFKGLILTVTLAVVWACGSTRTNTSTVIGNPGDTEYIVDSSKISVGALSNGTVTVSGTSGYLSAGSSLSLSNLVVAIKKNSSTVKVLTNSQFTSSSLIKAVTSANAFSTSVSAEVGDTIRVKVTLPGADTETTHLDGTVASSAVTPAAVVDNDDGADVCDQDNANAALTLVDAVCCKISGCFSGINFAFCREGILASRQLDDEFGVPVEENSLTWQQVVDGVTDSIYVANAAKLSQCQTDINDLACATVETGYSADDPNNYENLENFIPEGENTCEGVF